jgi:hypothetical protein
MLLAYQLILKEPLNLRDAFLYLLLFLFSRYHVRMSTKEAIMNYFLVPVPTKIFNVTD